MILEAFPSPNDSMPLFFDIVLNSYLLICFIGNIVYKNKLKTTFWTEELCGVFFFSFLMRV